MTKYFLIVLICFAVSDVSAVGDFSGHWVAEDGEVVSQLGLNSKCSRVEITIEQTDTAVITKNYTSTCELFSSTWGPIEQAFSDGKVYEHGEQVGIINDTELLSSAPSGSVVYHYNLRLVTGETGEVEMESEYGTQNFVGKILIVARLKKRESATN